MGKFTDYKLKKQADTNSTTKYRQFREREIANQASQYIVEQLKNYEDSNSKFIQSYNDRFFNSDGKYISDKYRRNTQVELLFANKEKDRLEKQRQELIGLLDSYGSNFKEDWLKETQNYLNEAGNVYDKIIKTYSDDNDLFSQFENADEFNEWYEAEKHKEELRNTDLFSTEAEILELEYNSKRLAELSQKKSEIFTEIATKEYALNEQNRRADLKVNANLQKEIESLRAEMESVNKEIADFEAVYGNAKHIQKYLTELKNVYGEAKEFQETEALTTDALNAPDFKEFAQKGSEWGADTNFEIYGKDEGRGTYGFFNREKNDLISYYRNNLSSYENEAARMVNGPTKEMERAYHFAKEMTEDEYNIYAYYLGKGDTGSAKKYLDSIEQSITYRFAENFYEQNLKDANIFEQIIFGLSVGTEQFQTGLENLISDETEYDSSYRQLISGKVQEDLKDSTFGKVAYDLSVTTGNMLPSILTSAVVGYINPVAGNTVGTALMGASAKGNAYAEMINLGYTKEQASNYSTLVGASEAGLQYLLGGIGKLGGSVSSKAISSAVSKIDNVFARTAIQLGGSMLSEGAEEYLQEVLDPFFKNIAFGEDNDIRFISEEALYSGLLGALSAGVLEGGSTVGGNVSTYRKGKQIKAAGVTAEQLSELGSKLSVDSEAYKLAGRINEETGAYTIGRMFNELKTEITAQNKAEIKEALRAKGINPVSANSIANWMERVVAGKELTSKQKAALENNPVLGEVMRDVLYERNTTALQRQAGLDSIRSQLEEYQIKQALDKAVKQALDKAVKKAEKKKAKNTANNTADTQDVQNTAQQAEMEDFETEADTSLAESEKANEANPRVSDDGRTFNTKTGEDLDIVGIASVKDKTFKTADGQTVDSKDVSFATENEAVLFDSVLSMDLPTEIANAIIDGYIPSDNISVTDYLLGSNLAYRYGYVGAKDIELMLDSDVRNIPEHLSKGLYNLGRETAKAEISKEQAEIDSKKAQKSENKAKKKGRVTFDGKELSKEFEDSLTDIQRESIKGIKVIAEVLGNDVNLFASYEAKEGQYKGKRVYKDSNGNVKLAPNGFYNPDGSMNLDINSGNLGEGTMLYTLSHELTHHIRKWSPAKFKVLADFVVEQYSDNGIKINDLVYGQMAKAKKNGRSISYGTAYEEVIADACSTMLLDSNAIEKLAQKDKTLSEKIKSFIKDFINKINKLYKNFSPDAKEAQYVKDIKGMTDKLQALWFEGLEDAGESYKKSTETAENEDRYSFRNEDEVIELAVDSELADRLEKSKKSKYTIIKDYLVEKFYGQKFKLSDGIEAIMDKSDAQELSHKADMKKTAALSNLRDIIEKAHFLGKADKVNHKKFDAFRYYSIKVSFEGEVYDILLNVGHLKYQDEYHIYDITKKGETANQSSTGLSQPVGNAIKNSFSKSSLPQNSESSQGKFSLRESVEETKDLVAVHNISEENALYSERDPDSFEARQEVQKQLVKENAILKEDNILLKELVALQRKVTNGTILKKSSVDAVCKKIMKQLNVKGNTQELSKLLSDVYSYILRGKEVTWEDITEKAQPAINWIYENMQTEKVVDEYTLGVLREIRKSRVSLDETQKAEIKAVLGSYKDFQKYTLGKIIIAKDGLSMDSWWGEMNEKYPNIFDSDISSSDMPTALIGILDNLSNSLYEEVYNYQSEMTKQDVLTEIYDGYWDVSTLHTVADQNQKKINELKAKHKEKMSKVRSSHNKKIVELKNKHKQEIKEIKAALREKSLQKEKDIRTKYQESRQKSIEGREKTAMRHKIKKVVSELNNLLLHGSKEKNVKLGLQKAVASALKTINMDTVNADERVAKYDELIAKASDPVVIDSLKESRDRIKKQGDVLSDKLDALRDAYNDIINSNSKKGDIDFPDYYKAEAALVKQKIESVSDLVGDTPIRNMSLEQLNSVYDMYRMVLTTVRNANKVWRAGKLEDLQQNANAVMTELDMLPKLKEERAENFEKMREFAWNEMIPVYAFERLGSNTFKKFFWDTINAQNVFAEDIAEAKTFADAVREKYNYENWNRSEIHEFKLKDGRTFRVNLEHMMSIYAYSKRDQAVPHMTTGGFFFNDRSTFRKKGGIVKIIKSTEEGYKVDVDVLAEIKKSMPKECIAYVDEMQDYLTKMGEKGNEVSRVIWGIDIFKEKVYFPLKSVKDFVFQTNQPTQETSLKNDGMTKETKPNASNPIVLDSFDDIWASHVNRMSQYHAFVIPIDNLNKVYNYGTWLGDSSKSVSTIIGSRHGRAANEYLTQFVQDLNGGISVKGASNPLMNMFGKFKKTAVAASTSVVVQQPTAILRATALIDPKYFVGKPNIHMVKQYEQLKKYAPIAIIKEIGGFDAGAGRQATNWLNDDTKQGVDKALQKIDDISMLGAAWGDILGWCTIWDAVKREVKANNKGMDVNSEEFLNLAGKRFTEVIVYTQVYDSTLSRSGYMRSKHDSVKMLTAFMGEPTVSVNMMYNAILQAKRGGKGMKAKAVRTIGAVYLSTIAASAAASAIYALRDDDDEETYMEKFAEAWSDKMLGKYGLTGELNPLTQLPAIKDIISIFEGWDVERTDIAVIKDIKDAYDGLFSDNKSTWKKIEVFSGAIASLFGLPVKNVLRTGREIYNAFKMGFSDVEGGSFGEAFVRGMTGEKKSKPNKLYDAIVNGDEEMLKILREGYDDAAAYETAVKKALRENDPRIKEAAEAGYNGDVAERVRIAKEIIAEGNFSQDIVVEAINAAVNSIKKGSDTGSASENEEPEIEKKESIYSTSDIATAFESGDTEFAKEIIADIVAVKAENYMTEDESLKQKDAEEKAKSSVKGTVTSYWKPLYIEAYNSKNADEMRRIRFALKDTGLYGTANDIISTCNNWVKESRKK